MTDQLILMTEYITVNLETILESLYYLSECSHKKNKRNSKDNRFTQSTYGSDITKLSPVNNVLIKVAGLIVGKSHTRETNRWEKTQRTRKSS